MLQNNTLECRSNEAALSDIVFLLLIKYFVVYRFDLFKTSFDFISSNCDLVCEFLAFLSVYFIIFQ